MKDNIKDFVEDSIRLFCEWKRVEIMEVSIQPDHIYVVVFVEPKFSISDFMGIIKGKTAIKIFKSFQGLKKKLYWGIIFAQGDIAQAQFV